MNKFFVYFLGIITGVILTFAFAFCANRSDDSEISGLELFEEPGEYLEYSQFEVFQVTKSGCALAYADDFSGAIVFILPNDGQEFYDDQKIVLKNDQCAQRMGTYKYSARIGIEKTVPAIQIIDGVAPSNSNRISADNRNNGKTFFDEPGDCVSRKNFEVQKVLESGDAIAREIRDAFGGYIFTSDLEVLILAQEGSCYYDKQTIKAPRGKCARQIGVYNHQELGSTKVIPIVAFK